MDWQISILALLLAAHAVITEVRIYNIKADIRQESNRIDGVLALVDEL